jgi:nucleolar protein 4
VIELLNNNKHVFGPNRRPIVQFSVENRQALQLQEQRRERVHAKQELLKNPTNKTLAFESSKKRKRREESLVGQPKNQTRLSEIIKKEAVDNDNAEDDQKDVKYKTNSMDYSNTEKPAKKKRVKTKSKGEIRDKIDRMIDKTRNKPQFPQRTKKKWFE